MASKALEPVVRALAPKARATGHHGSLLDALREINAPYAADAAIAESISLSQAYRRGVDTMVIDPEETLARTDRKWAAFQGRVKAASRPQDRSKKLAPSGTACSKGGKKYLSLEHRKNN